MNNLQRQMISDLRSSATVPRQVDVPMRPVAYSWFPFSDARLSPSPALCSSLGRLAEAAVYAARGGAINLADLRARTRCHAPIARARQAAIYLAHVGLGLNLTNAGLVFGRDRTTVRHACHLMEDSRVDDLADLALSALEIGIAAQARSLNLLH